MNDEASSYQRGFFGRHHSRRSVCHLMLPFGAPPRMPPPPIGGMPPRIPPPPPMPPHMVGMPPPPPRMPLPPGMAVPVISSSSSFAPGMIPPGGVPPRPHIVAAPVAANRARAPPDTGPLSVFVGKLPPDLHDNYVRNLLEVYIYIYERDPFSHYSLYITHTYHHRVCRLYHHHDQCHHGSQPHTITHKHIYINMCVCRYSGSVQSLVGSAQRILYLESRKVLAIVHMRVHWTSSEPWNCSMVFQLIRKTF